MPEHGVFDFESARRRGPDEHPQQPADQQVSDEEQHSAILWISPNCRQARGFRALQASALAVCEFSRASEARRAPGRAVPAGAASEHPTQRTRTRPGNEQFGPSSESSHNDAVDRSVLPDLCDSSEHI